MLHRLDHMGQECIPHFLFTHPSQKPCSLVALYSSYTLKINYIFPRPSSVFESGERVRLTWVDDVRTFR